MQFEFDPSDRRCRYLRINGARCRRPALDGDHLCFDHKMRKLRSQPGRKPASLPSSTFNEIPLVSFCWVEDHASILHNLNNVIEAFARGAIDHRQAMTYACLMRTALKTLRQMHDLEDETDELREKPAQRFELDDSELPLAIDDPAPSPASMGVPHVCEVLADMGSPDPASPLEPETCDLQPATGTDPGVPHVCEVLADKGRPDLASPLEPETCDLQPATGTDPGVPHVCEVLADKGSPDPASPLEPATGTDPGVPHVCEVLADMGSPDLASPLEPATGTDPGVPHVCEVLADMGSPDLASPLEPATCNLPLGNLPDAAFLALNPHWEATMREHYRNDPVLLASIGLQPRPNRAKPNPADAADAPCTPHPEPCTLTLTAAAEKLPAPGYPLPASLSPIPLPATPALAHTYTSFENDCEPR